MTSFFISYNQADRDWAVWIAWHLERSQYTTVIQAWDFLPGCNFVSEMQTATSESERTIAVLSPEYLTSLYAQAEWAAAIRLDPTGQDRRLVPIRVRECQPTGLLSQIVHIDLVGLPQDEAVKAILSGVGARRSRPLEEPPFPAGQDHLAAERPRFPGDSARVTQRPPDRPSHPDGPPDRPPLDDATVDQPRESWQAILDEFLRLPKVRAAVIACTIDCTAMCQQLDDLMTYKELHDQLHQLQFYCYDPIVRALGAGTGDLSTFTDYELNLQDIVTNLRKIDRRLSSERSGVDWIQRIDDARRELYAAIEHADPGRLQRAMNSIGRVLDRQPSRINEWIVDSARELRLNSVVAALAQVCDELTEHDIDLAKVRVLKDGLAELSRLTDVLTLAKDDHARWQKVDLELRAIDAWINRSSDGLADSWPTVRQLIDPLCGGSRDDWAVRFNDTSSRLDKAISSNEKDATALFTTFRSQAGRRFFHVDTDMKAVCQQLNMTGRPLVVALGVLT